MAASAITIGTMPPIRNKIGQPYCGTRNALTAPPSAPPSGTQPTATIGNVARMLRGADSVQIATRLGMTPPMPRPAISRSQNSCVRSAE